MTSLVFPDINVWLALSYNMHRHHHTALGWFAALGDDAMLVFCRHTQLGWFRLLTTEAVLSADVRTQKECWALFDQWIDSGRAILANDPAGLDDNFRSRATVESPSPKVWADAYLAAFAETGQLTLVTFDRALAATVQGAMLLG
jgi:toxin-antitoxin system PIN domain toxin